MGRGERGRACLPLWLLLRGASQVAGSGQEGRSDLFYFRGGIAELPQRKMCCFLKGASRPSSGLA